MNEIENIRKKIDDIDLKILQLLNDRAKLALEIKKTNLGKSPIRPERENSIIRNLTQKNVVSRPNAA